MKIKNGKKIVTVLLALSCIISGIILAAIPDRETNYIENHRQLDSLINDQIFQTQIRSPQIRAILIPVDSSLYRKVYRVNVPSQFSKTMFHISLNSAMQKYGVETPARVHFPERDMDIYIYLHDSIQRTIRLITDTSLDTLRSNEEQ